MQSEVHHGPRCAASPDAEWAATICAAARAYAAAGFAPVPVPFCAKRPKLPGWQKLRLKPEDIPQYFDGQPRNIGLILGVGPTGGLVDVDLDTAEAAAAARELLPNTSFRYGRQSKPASHAMYVCEPVPVTRQYKCPVTGASLVELRGLSRRGTPGAQSLVPPSVHPSGERIRFEPGGGSKPARVSPAELERAVARVAAAALLARHWVGEGARNQAFLALAGLLARARWSQAETTQFARALYRSLWSDDADLAQAEREVSHTYERYRQGNELTGYPRLAELINEKVLRTALRWLGIETSTPPRTERIVQPSGDARAELEVLAGRMAQLAEQAERILAEAPDCDLYQNGGRLVIPVREARLDGRASYALVTADENALVLRLSEHIRFVKRGVVRGMPVTMDAEVPRQLPAFMLARRGRWQYRYLRGVVSVPVIRPDWTIAIREGYDAATGLLVVNLPHDLQIPERPTRADAVQALKVLSDLLREFPFEAEIDAVAALSALLSAVLRPSVGPVPLHLFTAPVSGSGKTYLYEVCGALAIGMRPPILAAAGLNVEELDKRLAAALLAGRSVICLDNLEGTLQSPLLCQAVASAAPLEVRRLGSYDSPQVEVASALFATGNNAIPTGDLLRRTIPVRLNPQCERPELRSFAFDPLHAVLESRGRYLAACFTIPLAYRAASMPDKLPPLASFERWSDLVRSALYWLTRHDCAAGMEALRREDPALEAANALLQAWHGAVGEDAVTAKELLQVAEANGTLRDAILAVAGKRGEVDVKRLGYWLRAWKGRIVGGLVLEPVGEDTHSKTRKWRVTTYETQDCGV
jgi:putative DNA primase/helicase